MRARLDWYLAAAVIGATAGLIHSAKFQHATSVCTAIDGDTLNCGGGLHLRLNGIDAPELAGHCRPGRACVSGDSLASKRSLQALLAASGGEVRWTGLKLDRYGRLVAQISLPSGVDLSCAQLYAGEARYARRWDEGGLTSTTCLSYNSGEKQ